MVSMETVLGVLLVVLVPAGTYAQQTCEADHECPDGRFCYDSTKVCAPCIACAAYNRRAGARRCAKDWQACGACLQGFASEDIPSFMQRGNCIKSPSARLVSPQPTVTGGENYMEKSASQVAQIVIGVSVAVTLASVSVYFAISKGRRRLWPPTADAESGTCEVGVAPLLSSEPLLFAAAACAGLSADPPAYSQFPHYPTLAGSVWPSAPDDDGASVCVRVSERHDEKLQQARPFAVDDAIEYKPDEATGEAVAVQVEDNESQTGNDSARATPVNALDDESTSPSDWVPSNEALHTAGSLDDSGVCNISGSPSTTSLNGPPLPLDFSGMFSQAGAVARRTESGERPAKRFRSDSGAHCDDNSSSDEDHDEKHPDVENVSFVRE